MWIEGYIIFLEILLQIRSAEDLSNLDKLVIIVMSMEERLLAENLK